MRTRRQARRALGAAAAIGILIGTVASLSADDGVGGAAAATRAVTPAPAPLARATSGFAAGACIAYAPLGRTNGLTVFVDAGHGGRDTGAVVSAAGRTLREKDLTLAIARRLLGLLRQRGYRVVLSRTTGSGVTRPRAADVDGRLLTPAAIKRDIVARNVCANAARADAAVSVHLNSFDDPAVRGTETVYNANRTFSARNRTLAALLQEQVHLSLERAGLAATDRGIRTDEGAGASALTAEAAAYGQLLLLGPAAPPWFSSPTRMPAALVEALFLTNASESRFAATPAGQLAIARGLLAGIDAYLDPAPSLS